MSFEQVKLRSKPGNVFFVANANKPKLLRNANVKLFDNHGLKQALAEELADFLTGYTKDSYSG